jgi:hypothetical protein
VSLVEKDPEEDKKVDPDMNEMRIYRLQKRRSEIIEELTVIDQSLNSAQNP